MNTIKHNSNNTHIQGSDTGFLDKNGRSLMRGDRVHVVKNVTTSSQDGWGRDTGGIWHDVDSYFGRIFYHTTLAQFRIDDERFGDGRRHRGFDEFDEIVFAQELGEILSYDEAILKRSGIT